MLAHLILTSTAQHSVLTLLALQIRKIRIDGLYLAKYGLKARKGLMICSSFLKN